MVLAQSQNLHLIQRLSLEPPMTTLTDNQHCYAKGSYGSHTTFGTFWLAAWIGCPDTIHFFSVLCFVGLGHPFLAFIVMGSQAQIVMSFV
jgi:hypothetical protein